jgi:hypothetical protein
MNGTYEEDLKSAGHGTFRVTKNSWSIRYYFSGPDMRYNGTWVTIEGRDIDKYISAYRANWKEYLSLKTQIPQGGSFNKPGLQGMSINVGSGGIYREGICIDGWHMPINNEKELNALLESFEYCKTKAPTIMEWLSKN